MKARNRILTDHTAFLEALLSETSHTPVDLAYGPALRVVLCFIWRGCTLARSAGLSGKAPPNNSLIALSAYKALLPIIQLIRLGYHADALTLTRALMERIAIVGYLGANRGLIPSYVKGRIQPHRAALAWAKRESIENWMVLYGLLSNIAHSRVEAAAGHIFDATAIGDAFREIPFGQPKPPPEMTEVLLAVAVYSLIALDPLALALVNDTGTRPFPTDKALIAKVGIADTRDFLKFLQGLVQKYGRRGSSQSSP